MGHAKPEIEGRLGKAAAVFNKLKPLWKDADCSEKWKLRVCNATVFPVLTYGLDSVPFTKALCNRVDCFQTKCCRTILRIKAAYYSQISNKEILDNVSMILNGEAGKTQLVSRSISNRAITLLN